MKYLLIMLCVSLASADILIGNKPCLWRRAVTVERQGYTGKPYTMWMDEYGQLCFKKTKQCKQAVSVRDPVSVLDTVSWETYWDSCPARNYTDSLICNYVPVGGNKYKAVCK